MFHPVAQFIWSPSLRQGIPPGTASPPAPTTPPVAAAPKTAPMALGAAILPLVALVDARTTPRGSPGDCPVPPSALYLDPLPPS